MKEMKDRQFMMMLGLVVAAGLVMGLIAFRVSGGSAATATAASANKQIGGDPNAPHPSAADEIVPPQPDSTPQAGDSSSANGEPIATDKDVPELQGPTSGDPPGTAADPAAANAPPSPLPVDPPAGDTAQ